MALNLIDSSVWVEWFRDTKSKAADAIEELARHPLSIATTQPILMELQAGATTVELAKVNRIVGSFTMLGVDVDLDFVAAADIYRAVRRTGHTPRSVLDCLIASVAVRRGAVLVHRDVDMEWIAEVVPDLATRSLR